MSKLIKEKPGDFVDVTQVVPEVLLDVKYYTGDNFIGEAVEGYSAPRIYLSEACCRALGKAQEKLLRQDLGFLLYDGYRPMRASRHFYRWRGEAENFLTKERFYPAYAKDEIFELGFVALYSEHSRGSTVDLTIVDRRSGRLLDMGSEFDFFGDASRSDYTKLSTGAMKNRLMLKYLMLGAGFRALEQEWWHFKLIDEPYPDTYFDFPIV